MNETIDTLIKLCLFLEAVIGAFWFSIHAFAEEKQETKPEAKTKRPQKKLEVHPAVKENPELFAYVDGRVVLKKHLKGQR